MYRKRHMVIALVLTVAVMIAAMSSAVSAGDLTADEAAARAQVGMASPVIISAEPCQEGVRIDWEPIEGVRRYRVYRWYDDGRGWVTLQDTDALFYVDTGVASGNSYRYRLVGVSAGGSILTLTATKTVDYYAPSSVTSVENKADGIRICWSAAEGVDKVAVYRMENGDWRRLAAVSGTSYTDKDVAVGGEYRYTVRPLAPSGGFLYDFYDRVGVTVRRCAIPSLSASCAMGGVKVSWGAVEGAEAYRVFYKKGTGDWARLGDTTAAYLLAEGLTSGERYTFTVRCISADGRFYTSYFDTAGKSLTYVAAPALTAAAGVNDGIRVSWKASAGASKYRVYRKNSSGGWTTLGDTSALTYTDKNVASGTVYIYTVRCMDASGSYVSSYDSDGVSGMYLSAPVVSVSSGADGVSVSWPRVSGAVNYRVFRYGEKGWEPLNDTTSNSFTDTSVISGNTYTYTVRCMNAESTVYTSGYLAGKSVKYIAAPVITLKNTADGVKVSWNKPAGAERFRLYYYGEKGWTKLTDTASTSYLDKNVRSGNTYTYTVRCTNAASTVFTSGFKPGVSLRYVAAPDVRLSYGEDSIALSWDAVPGAELYRVFTRTDSGWVKLADTAGTSYTDKSVVSGDTYTYTVRCMNADASAYTSDYLSGKSLKFVAMPRITKVSGSVDGVTVSWGAVGGAEKYRLYRRTTGGWTRIGDTTATSYVDTQVPSGTTVFYTVRCINTAATAFESAYDKTGVSLDYIAVPKSLKASSSQNSVKISWAPSAGAEKYRVFRYDSKGWTPIADTAETSALDTSVSSGNTYRYTVRCITSDGKRYTSDYDREGASCFFTSVPALSSFKQTKDGVELSWGKVNGAPKYRVFRYDSKGWTLLKDTASLSYVDTTVASGKTYRYTVRCITADGKSYTSDYDAAGISGYYVAAPKPQKLESTSHSVTVRWTKPAGAEKYRFYKKVNGAWKKLADTTANTYTDNDVTLGNTYAYTVRVINSAATAFYSGFDPDAFIVTAISDVSGFCYYNQGDYTYPYGDDTIAYSGCGPTAFAMVASTITGRTITPVNAAEWCGNNYYIAYVGTRWDYFAAAAAHFGITMEKQLAETQFDAAVEALKQGKYVISSQRAGLFTTGGHFIVLAGIDKDGKIIVFDPNGGNHYIGTSFTKEQVSVSGTQYWVFDK